MGVPGRVRTLIRLARPRLGTPYGELRSLRSFRKLDLYALGWHALGIARPRLGTPYGELRSLRSLRKLGGYALSRPYNFKLNSWVCSVEYAP